MDNLIGYAGILTTIALLLLINRHIIGWVWYNFFPPLVIGRAMSTIWIANERILIVILSSMLWWIGTKIATNYINFSLYPKYSLYLLISLSVLISIGTWYIDYTHGEPLPVDLSYTIILFFLIVVSMSIKTYISWKGVNSFARRIHITWFFCISFWVNILLQQDNLYHYFSQHGLVIVLIGIVTIFVWSYTWLQLKEIIRFRKLIRNKITNKKKRI